VDCTLPKMQYIET